jgi:hypothetical protein
VEGLIVRVAMKGFLHFRHEKAVSGVETRVSRQIVTLRKYFRGLQVTDSGEEMDSIDLGAVSKGAMKESKLEQPQFYLLQRRHCRE